VTTAQDWRTAARIHTLPAAIVPVAVGGGLAWGDGVFRWDAFGLTLIAALAIQVAANFANDVSDARRGADNQDRVGPPRMVALGRITPLQMWWGVGISVGVAALAGIGLALIAGPMVLAIGLVSLVARIGYVGGPFPYGYHGLGELFVFIFFGVVATVGSRYVYDMSAPLDAWLLSIPIGLLASALLVVNNIRDIDTDRESGKRTLAVILGRERTRRLYGVLVIGSYLLIVAFALAGWTPWPTILAAVLLPWAIRPIRVVRTSSDGPSLVQALVMNGRLHLWTGLILAVTAAL
jgi:1,4-dihydroxy-2-naphthoate octaprenyltransferase